MVSFRYVIIKIIIVKKNSSFIGENRGKEKYENNHTKVSNTYVPSSLLECKELSPVSELESVLSPVLTPFPLTTPSPAFKIDLAFWLDSLGKSGNSGVLRINSLSLNLTLFS